MDVPGDLTSRVVAAGTAAGLAGVGVCDAAPFTGARRALGERVAAGMHAGMHFTFADPERSTDVRRSLPWARRLVVGAWSYLPDGGDPGPPAPGTGRVARFATEDHYRGLRAALGAVAAVLAGAGRQAEVLVDDNRLVDRAAAVRAGVGWWGKNTMVLAPGAGPWLLVGSVATDALLRPGSPMARSCGTCSACLPACPTGALVAPGVLDARRCIAYWAQAPGAVPRWVRPLMGDRLYGCDDCLEACPPGTRRLAAAAPGRGRVDLARVLAMDDRSLLAAFAHFYIPRRRPRYLRRNALVALGNAGGPPGVAAGYLGHFDPLLRGHAAWAVGRLGFPGAAEVLRTARRAEEDAAARGEIEAALAELAP